MSKRKYGVRTIGSGSNGYYYAVSNWVKSCYDEDCKFGTNDLNVVFEFYQYLINMDYSNCEVFEK